MAELINTIMSSGDPAAANLAQVFISAQEEKRKWTEGAPSRELTQTLATEELSPEAVALRGLTRTEETGALTATGAERTRRTGIESKIDTLLTKSNWTLADATKFDALSASIGRQANLAAYYADQLRTRTGLTPQDRKFNALSTALRQAYLQRMNAAKLAADTDDEANQAVADLTTGMMEEMEKLYTSVYGIETPAPVEPVGPKSYADVTTERLRQVRGVDPETGIIGPVRTGLNPFAGAVRQPAGGTVIPNPATVQQVVAFLRGKPDWKLQLDRMREAAEAKRDEQAWAEADEVESILSATVR
jgi:hypothetical protein